VKIEDTGTGTRVRVRVWGSMPGPLHSTRLRQCNRYECVAAPRCNVRRTYGKFSSNSL